ncbi:MAG TPA: TonB-dependent receptor [Terriglobales bacterium]|nr:TonB-dependent receptor [Terriglobales bacterium]
MHARFAAFLIACSVWAHAAEIRGKVVTVDGGEALARVQVTLLETSAQAVTDGDGAFVISGLAAGNFTLRFNAIGYRLVTVPFTLPSDESVKEFDVTLVPDNFRRTEKVEVKGDIFHGPDSPAVIEANLTSSELRETSTVLADDPFRSIQTLPGVSASGNNDFYAQFSVMGVPFENTGTYLDGILVPQPFHGLTNISEGATLSILTSETIEDLKLLPVAYPQKFGDTVGAALDVHTRDGSRTAPIFRASVGLVDSDILGEGRLGRSGRGSWLASARKSYLGYLLRNRLHDNYTDVSFYDGSLKLTYDVRPNHTLTFYGVGGHTFADLVNAPEGADPNNFQRGTNDFVMARTGWRWTVSPRLSLATRAAYLHTPDETWNVLRQMLSHDHHAEWVAGADLSWTWRSNQVVEAGWMVRRVSDRTQSVFYNPDDTVNGFFDRSNRGWKNDAYVQNGGSYFHNRLHVAGSVRVDAAEQFPIHPLSPQLSTSLQVSSSTQLQFGIGRYNQFQLPATPLTDLGGGLCYPASEVLQTANHYSAGVEHRFGETTRIRALFFDREGDTSSAANRPGCCNPVFPPHAFNAFQHSYSRGVQFTLQSRTASRLSGWIAYTFTYASESDLIGPLGDAHFTPYFPSLADQRHTLNLFASYRVSPTVRIGGKWLYGSGFPIPSENNDTRLGDYQRLDLRGEKDWAFTRWKLTLYGEVLNLTDHANRRYFYSAFNPDGTATVVTGQGLPVTPSAGLAFEF